MQHKKTKKVYIIDHKTTSMDTSTFGSISTKLQPYIYSYFVKNIYGLENQTVTFVYNVIKKISSLTRMSKADKGDYDLFYERMLKKVDDSYFKMYNFDITLDESLDEKVFKHIAYYINSLRNCNVLEYYPCNELACNLFGECEYKKFCNNNFKITKEIESEYTKE